MGRGAEWVLLRGLCRLQEIKIQEVRFLFYSMPIVLQ